MSCPDFEECIRRLKALSSLIGFVNLILTVFHYRNEDPVEELFLSLVAVSFIISLLVFFFSCTQLNAGAGTVASRRLDIYMHLILGTALVSLSSYFIAYVHKRDIVCVSAECTTSFARRFISGILGVLQGLGFCAIGCLSTQASGRYEIIH